MAKKDLQRDAFFAHSDQLLLAMCADKDEEVRRKAVKLIRNLRQQVQDELQEDDDTDFDSDTEVEVDEELLRYTDDEETDEEEEEEDPALCWTKLSGKFMFLILSGKQETTTP